MVLSCWGGGLIGVSKDQVKASRTLMSCIEHLVDGGEGNGDNRVKLMRPYR